MRKFTLFKRPVITIFFFYAAFLILLDLAGVFEPSKQSVLYHFAAYGKPAVLEGKVVSAPEPVKNGQRFILKARLLNGYVSINEKILVNAPSGYKISYGDIISIEGKLSRPKEPDFPLVFNYRKYLSRMGIYVLFKVSSFEHIEAKPNPVKKLAISLRRNILDKTDAYFKKPYAGVLKPVIIGDTASLEPQIKENFMDAGLMHVLVVSGLHVGFVGGMLLAVFKICGLSLRKASLLSIPFIFLYVLAAGANPPAMRAAIMFASVLTALALDREPLIYNSLALSALLILLFTPQQLFTASFQLSYAATIGIVYFYEDIYGIFGNIKNALLRFFAGIFSVTVSAQILLIPVCMYYFGKISPVSFVSNIIVVPLIGIITPLGFAFYFSAFIFSYLSLILSSVISILLHLILVSVNLLAGFGFSSVLTARPSLSQIVLFFFFFFALTGFRDKRRFIFAGICLALSFFNVLSGCTADKNKIIFNVYDGYNTIALQEKNRGANSFILYQKRGRYDKYYMDSFLSFLSLSGIKNARISLIGFDEQSALNQIKNAQADFIKTTAGTIGLNADGNIIKFDMDAGKIYVNGGITLEMNENPSFYYHMKKKEFTFKKT